MNFNDEETQQNFKLVTDVLVSGTNKGKTGYESMLQEPFR